MRGKKRTKEERNELFETLEEYLKLGFSLKKACAFAELPYSTIRDIVSSYEPLRAKTTALQNTINVEARQNIVDSIKGGNVKHSMWWLNKFDNLEPQISPEFGGKEEMLITYTEYQHEDAEKKKIEYKDFIENRV